MNFVSRVVPDTPGRGEEVHMRRQVAGFCWTPIIRSSPGSINFKRGYDVSRLSGITWPDNEYSISSSHLVLS